MISKKGLTYALISSATFGLITLFTVPVIHSGTLNSVSILFYRLLFATLGVGVACLINRDSFAIRVREIPKLLLLGIFYGMTAFFLLLSYSLIPSGISTTIHFLYPVAVTLLMILF
ncbi:MAG: EamA family transporter, partial [Rikenellaceae bacterium]